MGGVKIDGRCLMVGGGALGEVVVVSGGCDLSEDGCKKVGLK